MAQRRGESRPRNMAILAGWLFADLLLGLMVIFLVSSPGAIPKSLLCLLTPTAVAATLSSPPTFLHRQRNPTLAENILLLETKRSMMTSDQATPNTVKTPTTACPTATPTSSPTPTSTPGICGLDLQNRLDETIPLDNSDGLRNQSSTAEQDFATTAQTTIFAPYANRVAGYVEVFGGPINHNADGSGENLARGIIGALKLLEKQHFIFNTDKTFFQDPEFLGQLNNDQAHLFILFYQFQPDNGSSCT